MKPALALSAAILVGGMAVGAAAQSPTMPLADIKPGMVGVGRTVFQGTQLTEFQAHILGVLHNIVGPNRSLILTKLTGGPLAETGVIAGMSGSPVYIDGKLIGAISYSLGSYSKEAIAGITPIAEMTEATTPVAHPRVRVQAGFPLTRDSLARTLRDAFAWARPLGPAAGTALSPLGEIGSFLAPIGLPLVFGGFSSQTIDAIAPAFREFGFSPMAGGTSSANGPLGATNEPFGPGDAVGITLVTGDLNLSAVGTVTEVVGDRVYAFGHPFYNLGPTEFPMTRAYVHAILPSLLASQKIATTGQTIGTFQQDRSTAIAGLLGKPPEMIPVKLSIETSRGQQKRYHFDIVNDQLFTPLLTYLAILNTLQTNEREYGVATFLVKGKAQVKGHDEVTFEDLFTADTPQESPSTLAAAYIAAPINFLLANDFEALRLEDIDLSITSLEQPRTATLERVWLDEIRPRAGKTVPLKALLRTYRGEEVTKTVPVDIPANASGSLSLLVSDGSTLTQWEQREVRQPFTPHGVDQLIRAINGARKNNRLYIRLLSSEPGAVIKGEYMGSLPPSVLAVMESDRNGGNFIPLRSATIGETEVQTDYAVGGSRLLTINVDPE